MNQQQSQPGLYIGIDWADQKHDVYVIDRTGKGFHQQIEHSAEKIEAWVSEMLKLAGGQPIAVMLEQSRGALIHALMFREDVLLYPVNPKQLARFREALGPSGAKDDPTDAWLLAELLAKHSERLRPWQPDEVNTRKIRMLAEDRRNLVNQRTALTNRLKSR